MGKGDKKTAKGKRSMGSYGNSRKQNTTKPVSAVEKPAKASSAEKPKVAKAVKSAEPKAAAKKAPAKKTTKKDTEA